MRFTIAVHGAPYASQSQHHALQFCRACVRNGHQIARVFFYHEGVYAALAGRVAPQDEADITAEWLELAAEHTFELAVCIANGLKRGVINGSEAERYGIEHPSLAPGFELVGLGQLIDAIVNSERYVEFPA